jgi:hypothetical protein
MKKTTPKAGEHPLATKLRQEHRHLATAYAGLLFFDLLGTLPWAQLTGIWPGYIVGGLLAAWFLFWAYQNWMWSR